MRKEVIICDVCGKEIKRSSIVRSGYFLLSHCKRDIKVNIDIEDNADICECCFRNIINTMSLMRF